MGRVWISGVCDPYQAAEKRYRLTARCLEILLEHQWPVTIQTKSSLVLRDIEILAKFKDIEVGFSITTADEKIREIFEPGASPIKERIRALDVLHSRGISTFAMIAPILPRVGGLIEQLSGKVDHILIDRLNYSYATGFTLTTKWNGRRKIPFFFHKAEELKKGFIRREYSRAGALLIQITWNGLANLTRGDFESDGQIPTRKRTCILQRAPDGKLD